MAMTFGRRRRESFFRTPLVATLRLVATQTVGSNMILMVGSNEVRGRYIVRIQNLTVKPYVRDANLFCIALSMLEHVGKLDLATTKFSDQFSYLSIFHHYIIKATFTII